ncbi:MAG: 2-oxo acid dehydrogenase subunit E2, partial [Planctomycetota bacterium]
DDNLLVPVIKDVDKKSIIQLAKDIKQITELAREKKLTPQHYSGAGFTVTSLGKLGGVFATPVVNHPQISILGVHKISIRPVYIGDIIEPRNIMNLSLTSDHRVIEGDYAANFLHDVIKYLQNPKLLVEYLM